MKRIILGLFIVGCSLWVGIQFHNDPGRVIIFYKNYSIESTLLVALSIIVLIFLLLQCGLFLFRLFRAFPKILLERQNYRQKQKLNLLANKKLISTILTLSNWDNALNIIDNIPILNPKYASLL